MQACYPLITAVSSARFALPSNAVPMFLGIFAMNGIAEEMRATCGSALDPT